MCNKKQNERGNMTKYNYNCNVLTNEENLEVMKKVFLSMQRQCMVNVCNRLFYEKSYRTFITHVGQDLLSQGVKMTRDGIKQADKFFRTNNIKSVNQISKHYKGGK